MGNVLEPHTRSKCGRTIHEVPTWLAKLSLLISKEVVVRHTIILGTGAWVCASCSPNPSFHICLFFFGHLNLNGFDSLLLLCSPLQVCVKLWISILLGGGGKATYFALAFKQTLTAPGIPLSLKYVFCIQKISLSVSRICDQRFSDGKWSGRH